MTVTDDHCEVVLKRTGDNEEAWLDARLNGISGSDALAAMGYDPRKQRAGLWIEKTQGTSVEETEPMVMGRILEPAVKAGFTWKSGLEVVDNEALLRSVAYPWMLATPDGYTREPDGTPALFEAKTTTIWLAEDWADGIPPRAAAQTMHYLIVTGLRVAYVAVLIDNKVQHFRFEYDAELAAEIIRLEDEFWQYVQNREMPPMVPGRDAADLLDVMYPTAVPGKVREMTPAECEVATLFRQAGSQHTYWKKRREELNAELKIMAGDAEFLTWAGDPVVSVKTSERRMIDVDRLRTERPDIAKEFEKVTSARALRSLKRLGEVAAA